MALTDRSGTGRRLHAVAAAVALVVLLPIGVLEATVPLVQAVLAAALAVVLLRRDRSAGWLPWLLVVVLVLLAGEAVLHVLLPGSDPGRLVVVGVQVIGTAIAAPLLFHRGRRAARPDDPARTDLALVAVGAAVAVAAVVQGASTAGLPGPSVMSLAGDVVCLALVGWFWLSHGHMRLPVRQMLAGGVLYGLHDAADVLANAAPGALAHVGQALAVAAAMLLSWAAANPGLLAGLREVRASRGSARMRLVLAAAAVPPLVWVSGTLWPAGALPMWTLHISAFVITGLALWRAVNVVAVTERDAEHDPLTGLLDRRGLMRHLESSARSGRGRWLALVDLDDFKLVNDQRGHEAGDALLVAVARRLVSVLPSTATVGRLGGDELVVVFDAPTAAAAAARVLDAFVHPFALTGEGGEVRISASIGVTELIADTTVEAALVCADVAMYVAKRRGRDGWVAYDPSLREQVLGSGQLQRELRQLLHGSDAREGRSSSRGKGAGTADVGALVVHYQPVVDLASGLPCGVEALVRWSHPRRGLVPPDTFLPLAEAAGLGAAIDRWVLHQALHQVATWDAEGLAGLNRVAVNLGVSSVRSPSLGQDVEVALRASGTAHQRLLLEITEHEELQADRAAAQRLLALRDAGVTIALDDFGAGYASIGYLRRWPVNLIKLDRSMLPRALEDAAFETVGDPAALLEGVAALAGAMGHALVAEGIETPADERAVRAVGVRYGQGYLYSRPLPAGELTTWWRERTEAPAAAVGARASGGAVVASAR